MLICIVCLYALYAYACMLICIACMLICIVESVLNYHLTSIDKFNIETTDLEELKKMSVADLAKMVKIHI